MKIKEQEIYTVREALDLIDDMLCQMPSAESDFLYHVLSALRGPDADVPVTPASASPVADYEAKHATTAVIRSHAFPKTTEAYSRQSYHLFSAGGSSIGVIALDSPERCELRKSIKLSHEGGFVHFASHALDAFLALDLSWSSVNQLPRREEESEKMLDPTLKIPLDIPLDAHAFQATPPCVVTQVDDLVISSDEESKQGEEK